MVNDALVFIVRVNDELGWKMDKQRLNLVLQANLECLGRTVERMPQGVYREYCDWMLTAAYHEARNEWLQLMGIKSLIRLTVGLMEELITDDEWEILARYSGLINIQQMYEVVSDNLAIGLAFPAPDDDTFDLRRDLLSSFNEAMIARLEERSDSTERLLKPLLPTMNRVSTFVQSLSPIKHRKLADAFFGQYPELSAHDLEYVLWPMLTMNVETTLDLARAMQGHEVAHLTTYGLILRYASVNRLLANPVTTLSTRITSGIGTIMVIPTLAYYVGVLAEIVRPMDKLWLPVRNGALNQAFSDAALQVRLLNDMGTALLTQSTDAHAALMWNLRRNAAHSSASTLPALLLESLDDFGPLFTRIRKDLLHREFNICIHDYTSPLDSALPQFERELAHVRTEYAQSCNRLAQTLSVITDRLNDPTVSFLIARFVKFHEKLYTYAYDISLGEYAV